LGCGLITIYGHSTGVLYDYELNIGSPIYDYNAGTTTVTVTVNIDVTVYVLWDAFTDCYCSSSGCLGNHSRDAEYGSIDAHSTVITIFIYDEILDLDYFSESSDFFSFFRTQDRAAESAAIALTNSLVGSQTSEILVSCLPE
jgi:hypothetical protein